MFFRKQHKIEDNIKLYLERLDDMLFQLREAVHAYLKNNQNFDTRVNKIVSLEKELDTMRTEIQRVMYEESLVPESREDVLYLMGDLDHIPNIIEHSIMGIHTEQPNIPQNLHSDLLALLDKINLTGKALISASECLFSDLRSVRGHTLEVGRQEEEVDDIEYSLLRDIFSLEIDLAHKIQLKAIVRSLASIGDQMVKAAEYAAIFAIKRAM